MFFKVCGDARERAAWDAPYLLVDAGRAPRIPLGDPPSVAVGNVFTKGALRLGREALGLRSLHVVWIRHVAFQIENRPGDGFCSAPGSDDDAVAWDFDLMYAVSYDGGDSWWSFDGRARTDLLERIRWDDDRYRIWSGETHRNQAYAWDVDVSGNPVFALLTATAGSYKGDPRHPARWHVDQATCNGAGSDPPAVHELKLLRYDTDAGRWDEREVEAGCDRKRLAVHVAMNGDTYLFCEAPPRYSVTRDGGTSWSAWTRFDDRSCRDYADPRSRCDSSWRMQVMPDSANPNWLHVMFQSRGSGTAVGNASPVVVDNRYHYVLLQTADEPCVDDPRCAPEPPLE